MTLDEKLQKRLDRALAVLDESGATGPRLRDDARRLWSRLRKLVSLRLVAEGVDLQTLELSSYALQLPLRRSRAGASGKPGRATLRDRAEEAAELLLGVAADCDESLLDRTTRVLHEMPHRSPVLDEAKLLADAVNLEDFGLIGLAAQAAQLARHGEGVLQLADGLEKREQYGYWDARLKEGFHFEAVRQIAHRRLANARRAAELLRAELQEDDAPA